MERYLRTLVTENAAFKQAQSAGSSLDRTVRNAPEATDGTLQADDEMQSQPTVTIVSKGSSSEHERQISFEASTVCTSFGDELLSCFAHEEIRPDGTPAREYARDDCFNRLCGREYQLPNRVQANLLVRVASRYIVNDYHQFQMKLSWKSLTSYTGTLQSEKEATIRSGSANSLSFLHWVSYIPTKVKIGTKKRRTVFHAPTTS